MSMRLKLFMLLTVLVVTMFLGILIIMLMTGTLTAGLNSNQRIITSELNHISSDIENSYGKLSAETVYFSKKVSSDMEKFLKSRNLSVKDLDENTQILNELLSNEYDQTLFSLQKTRSSGIFIILNTTVNNKLPNCGNSKTGLYIKNMEPNIVNSTSQTFLMLRGMSDIARKNSINLHAQWKMEFDVNDAPYYSIPMEKSSEVSLPLSKLYYWCPPFILPGTSEKIMTCSAPLIDSDGNVFGVCGFDISEMLFKMSFIPDNSTFARIFCTLSPYVNNSIKTSLSLISGGYSSFLKELRNNDIKISYGKKKLYTYSGSTNMFMGYHRNIKLYPEGSAFSGQKWAAALMVPAEDIKSSVLETNIKLLSLCVLLMAVGIIFSLILSRYYIKPFINGINMIKANDIWDHKKTQIAEIDELIEYLKGANETTKEQRSDSKMLDAFLNNIKSLSPAEQTVFNLYAQQYSSHEIADMLCLSINTIKTHTKRIYIKLNVTSREELLLYIEMLKEAGKKIK